MVHCNPAPPHPPPGEVYNAICFGQPYIDGVPVGYAVLAAIVIASLLFAITLRQMERRDLDTQ